MFKNMSKILLVLIPLLVLACTDEPSSAKKDPVARGPYVVTFNTQGGSAVASLTVQHGERITAPAHPTKASVALKDWNTKADGTGTTWNFGVATATANITLYAQWTTDFHTVTFWRDVNLAVIAVVRVAKGNTVSAPTVSRTGYILDYWEDSQRQRWDFAANKVTGKMNLYGVWAKLHTVTFSHNYGTPAASTVVNVQHAKLVSAPTVSRTGYAFVNWYKKADGSGDVWDFAKNPVAADLTLYAKWTELHTVTFNHNYGATTTVANVKDGDTLSAPSAISRTGHAFVNWNKKADGSGDAWDFAQTAVTADVTLYAKWTTNYKTVTFDHNYGAKTTVINVVSGSTLSAPSAVTRPLYALDNWNKKADGTGDTWAFGTATVTAHITLYAKWTKLHQVTLNHNYGSPAASTVVNVKEGSTLSVPSAVARPGYRVGSWNTKANGTGTKWDLATAKFTAGTTLYAQWLEGQTHTAGNPEPDALKQAGKAFLGWYKAKPVSNTANRVDWANQGSADFIIYPKFVATTGYTIDGNGVLTKDPNGGSATVEIPYNVNQVSVRKLKSWNTIYDIFGTLSNRVVTTVYLPSKGLEEILSYSFYRVPITSITIPNTVTNIGEQAFSRTKLRSVTIPASVTNMGSFAFSKVTTLTSVRVEAIRPPIIVADGDIFGSSTVLTSIKVPAGSVDAYKTAAEWSTHASKISGYTE